MPFISSLSENSSLHGDNKTRTKAEHKNDNSCNNNNNNNNNNTNDHIAASTSTTTKQTPTTTTTTKDEAAKTIDHHHHEPFQRPQVFGWSFLDRNGKFQLEYASPEHGRRLQEGRER
ncbi:hypothetical protein BST61_g10028 [Cercospora zeina]